MRIPILEEKAKELEACAAKIAELLEAAKALDDAVIPDSVKNLSVWELEGAPVRVKNMLNNIGVRTLWELVHFDMAKYRACRGGFFASGRIFQNGVPSCTRSMSWIKTRLLLLRLT